MIHQVQPAVATVLHAIGEATSPQDYEGIRLGLGEILMNAIGYRNLAVGYAQKDAPLEAGTFNDLIDTRQHTEPYASRQVQIEYVIDSMKVTVTVCDEGAGFDWQAIPDPCKEETCSLRIP